MLINALLIPAAVYLLVAAVCISNRITRRTKLRLRLLTIGIGAVGMWAFSRSITLQWKLTPPDLAMALAVIGCAIILAYFPRVRV